MRKCEAGDAHCSTENLRIKRLMSEKKKRSFFEGNVKSKTRAFRPKKMFEKKTLLSEKNVLFLQAGKIRLFFLRKRAAGDPRRLVGKKFREKPFISDKSLCFFFAAFHQRTQLTTVTSILHSASC